MAQSATLLKTLRVKLYPAFIRLQVRFMSIVRLLRLDARICVLGMNWYVNSADQKL